MVPNAEPQNLPSPGDMPTGVFVATPVGLMQVHEHLGEGDDYGLADVRQLFGLGTVDRREDWLRLRLTRRELHELRITVDAYSFDYPAELIEMCMDMVRSAGSLSGDPLEFLGNF